MITFIYTLRREDSVDIKYIGKTIRPKRRFIEHVSDSNLAFKTNNHLKNWILKAKKEKCNILMEIIEEVSGNGCIEEMYWIEQFKNWEFKLVNITNGGDGFNKKHSIESKQKMSNVKKGKIVSNYTKLLMSESRKGFKFSEESKNKMSESKKQSKYLINHIIKLSEMKTKTILCIEDNLIFNSISKCCLYYNISKSAIANHLKGLSKKLRNGKSYKTLYYE